MEPQVQRTYQPEQPDQLPFNQTPDLSLATSHDTDTLRHSKSNVAGALAVNGGSVDIDQMLAWVARNGFSDQAVGYATKRICEVGTAEQLVAFTAAMRAEIRHNRRARHRLRRSDRESTEGSGS